MRNRFIYISGINRQKVIESQYGIIGQSIKKGDYLFKLDQITSQEKDILEKLNNTLKPFFKIIFSNSNCTILKIIPEKELLDQLNNYPCENSSLNDFFYKLQKYFSHSQTQPNWKLKNKDLDFKESPLIMGILNATPDSFSDGGLFVEKNKAVEHALKMVDEGADIIDIGGESSRPGAVPVPEEEEIVRVIPIIEEIKKHSSVIISIDTYKSKVAHQALLAGADIINDISGTEFDPEMGAVIKKFNCPVVLMHKQGMPKNMQVNPSYNDVQEEVYGFLEKKSLEVGRLNDSKIIIDPGIGFGKTLNHNFLLIRDVVDFSFIGKPILIGLSRKSFIGKSLDLGINDRLIGGIISEFYSVLNGVGILRVHDVLETFQAKRMIANILAA